MLSKKTPLVDAKERDEGGIECHTGHIADLARINTQKLQLTRRSLIGSQRIVRMALLLERLGIQPIAINGV